MLATMRFANRRRARITAGVAVAAAVALALVGCSGSTGTQTADKTTIRFLYATGDQTWNGTVQDVVKAFDKQSTDVNVVAEPMPAGSDYATTLKTMDATGKWPAIVDMRDAPTYIKAGKLAPIPTEITSLIESDAYAAASDGKVYTVPSVANNGEVGLNIVYDKAYFAKNGLSVPKNYSQFIGLLKKIKAKGDVPLATAGQDIWPSDQLWKPLGAPVFANWSSKGGFWASALKGDASIEDLRAPLEELKTITDNYVLKGWQSTADAQLTTLLVNHQAIMATSSAGIGRLLDIHKVDPKYKAGIFIIPDANGKIDVAKPMLSGDTASGLAISSQAAASKKQYAASLEFLKFYYSVKGADLIEKSGSIAPQIRKASQIKRNTSIPGSADYFALLKNPNLVWYSNDTNWSAFSTFNTFFRQARIEMQTGQTTVDQAIAKVQTEFDKDAKTP